MMNLLPGNATDGGSLPAAGRWPRSIVRRVAIYVGTIGVSSLLVHSALFAATVDIAEPFRGIRHIHRSTTVPRVLDMHLLEVDLNELGIDVVITPSNGAAAGETNGQTTRQFLTAQGTQLAINGSFSGLVSGAWNVEGIAVDRGSVYSEFQEFRRTALNISLDKIATIIRSTTGTGTDHTPVVNLYNTLGGEARLLNNGNNVAPSSAETLEPRTAVGVTPDNKLLLLTVDGRNTGHSLGMTRPEVADLLKEFGAWNAINLDGGGSTTMVFADPVPRVVNIPVGVGNVPGTERVVGSNFGLYADAPAQPFGARYLFADFEGSPSSGDAGNLGHALSHSGSTTGIVAATSSTALVNSSAHSGQWSQQLTITDDPNVGGGSDNPDGGWFVRHLSGLPGAASPGTRSANTIRSTTGRVGFWAQTTDPGMQITLAIDNTNNVTADRGTLQPLIADGQWHRYEWDLEDNSQWDGWFNGDGNIDPPDFTLDSIQILGPSANATIYVDDVFHRQKSILQVTGDYVAAGELRMEIGGAGPARMAGYDFDQIQATGNVTLGGTLSITNNSSGWKVDLVDLYSTIAIAEAHRGEAVSIPLITGGGTIGGAFASITYEGSPLDADTDRGIFKSVNSVGGNVVFTILNARRGDADGDLVVSSSDVFTTLSNLNLFTAAGEGWTIGNFDGDTIISSSDVFTALSNLGTYAPVPAFAQISSVPEPSTGCSMVMLLVGLLGVSGRSMRAWHRP